MTDRANLDLYTRGLMDLAAKRDRAMQESTIAQIDEAIRLTADDLRAPAYITQVPSTALSNEQALSLLGNGYAKVTTGTGVISTVATIPTTDLTGTITDVQHGNRGGGNLHDLVTTGTHGFMSATDKTKLDGVASGASTGTVTSVGLSLPAELTVSNSPVTITGTLTAVWATQTANKVFASAVSGGAATPGFRALVSDDIPALAASKITSGIFAPANGGTGTANSGNLAWPSGGGTAALLATANVFTTDQTIQPATVSTEAALYLRGTGVVAGTGGRQTIYFYDGAALAGRLMSVTTNAIGQRYIGYVAGVDRDGGKIPIRFFTQDASGVAGETLFLGADTDQGNIGFGTLVFGTNARHVVGIINGTAPSTSPANVTQFWSADRGGTGTKGGLHLRSEDGTSHVLSDRVGLNTILPTSRVHLIETDAATNSATTVLTIGHNSSGSIAAGFGTGILWQLESTTTEDQDAASLLVSWATATHASRKGRGVGIAYDTAARECWRWEASGSAAMIGFLGATAVVRQTLPAAATDPATTQTLANAIRTALINLGLS